MAHSDSLSCTWDHFQILPAPQNALSMPFRYECAPSLTMNLIYDGNAPGQQVTQLLELSAFAEVPLLGFSGSPPDPGFAPQACPWRVPAHQTLCTRHSNNCRVREPRVWPGFTCLGTSLLMAKLLPSLLRTQIANHQERAQHWNLSAHRNHAHPEMKAWVSRQDIGK